jgi:cytochrome bd-type quinol oxidase subunit 2
MTENPTETNENETNEKPRPLTRGEWLALLTAESQTVHGYMNLAVTVAPMFVAIVAAVLIYVASPHEGFNSSLTWIYVVIFVAVIFCILIVIWASKEEYENSETIREIISGGLTESDEIRR